ncbi:MAG: RdgB/HAM1 family non-canonical purine NTP pyrophosphatase [Ruminococcaceae bacterium]|nr:RdgB/HAM1 family non-canonical purine NTP pyrophosphatase [Oscillospiraceae bacterium]
MKNQWTVVLATRNRGKLAELERLLTALLGDVITLKSLDDVGITEGIEENGTTFEENALIKARAAAKSGYIAFADDSGLCVDALDGEPGVRSARYAGVHGNDAANNERLLQRMSDKSDRRAAFVAAFAAAFPDGGEPLVARGSVEGEILCAPRGEGGFGYDPLFYYPPLGKTFAELTGQEKNRISHRGAAVAELARLFAARMGLKRED